MTRLNDARIGMLRLLKHFLSKNANGIKNISGPIIFKYLSELEENLSSIISTSTLTDISTKGITKSKRDSRNRAINAAILIMNKIPLYAVDNNETILSVDTKVTKTMLVRLKDEELVIRLSNIISLANEQLTKAQKKLSNYGLENENIRNYKKLVLDYKSKTFDPRAAISQRHVNNKELKSHFDNTYFLVKKIDLFINDIVHSDPNLYNSYRSLRKTICLKFFRGYVTKSDLSTAENLIKDIKPNQ